MKCPICGKEHFIKSTSLPFTLHGDTRIVYEDGACLACVNCGYAIFFNSSAVNTYEEQKEAINIIKEAIEQKMLQIKQLKNNTKGLFSVNQELKRKKEELRLRREWGEDNKTTRALEETIKELNDQVNGGFVKNSEDRIKNLFNEVERLNEQILKIEESIKPVSL